MMHMTDTREKILRTLLSYPGSTIKDLADEVGINSISIRHHLTSLEAEDLVSASEERHGVGRPRLIYSLTDKGIEQFPSNYITLTKRLIEKLKNRLSAKELDYLFEEIGSEIAKFYEKDFEGKPLDDQLKILMKVMTREGFIVEVSKNKDAYILTTLSCPYFQLAAEFPEVCHMGQQLVRDCLSLPIEVETCITQGDEQCSFKIPAKKSEGKHD